MACTTLVDMLQHGYTNDLERVSEAFISYTGELAAWMTEGDLKATTDALRGQIQFNGLEHLAITDALIQLGQPIPGEEPGDYDPRDAFPW